MLERFINPANHASDAEREQAAALIVKLKEKLALIGVTEYQSTRCVDVIRISVVKIPKGVEISLSEKPARATSLTDFVKSKQAYSLLAYSVYELDSGMKMAESYFDIQFNSKEVELIRATSGLCGGSK